MSNDALAHSANDAGVAEPVHEHLEAVATRAARYAQVFGAGEEARMAGLLHDIGKYSDLFQRRLRGHERGVDHWSHGAWLALKHYESNGIGAALAIQGHHTGLDEASRDALRRLEPQRMLGHHPLGLNTPTDTPDDLLRRLCDDGLVAPDPSVILSRYGGLDSPEKAAGMFDIRMLFSALVDADFIETEAHFNGHPGQIRDYREDGPTLESDRDLDFLLTYLRGLAAQSKASKRVLGLRTDLLEACLEAGCYKQGLFTLTAPTGTGKTLSMLAFALRHAARHNLRRLVVVIPYLTIIDQTARAFRTFLSRHLSEEELNRYIVEDHSLAGQRRGTRPDTSHERLLAENWDAPIVVTTSVQFLESLFSNRSSACRKLHRLAKSIVLLDEVQTLPLKLAVVTLATLSALSSRYDTSIVFSTATQPAFSHLDAAVKTYARSGWNPREIVPSGLNLFQRARRVSIKWPRIASGTSWEVLADELADSACPQALFIVNLKRHALLFHGLLKERGTEGLRHLSTSMCPRHRENVLREVHERLSRGAPCRLVATQCVEAGVDIDFPVVYRGWGPLDAIAQAAGRCNRDGRQETGQLRVFHPEKEQAGRQFPDGAYAQAAGVASLVLKAHGGDGDICDPALFEEYYRALYQVTALENAYPELNDAIRRQDFKNAARLYRVIAHDAINVLVSYDSDAWKDLACEVRDLRLSASWIAKARPHTVGLFRPGQGSAVWSYLEPVPIRHDACSEDWFLYRYPEHYSDETGLAPSSSQAVLIG